MGSAVCKVFNNVFMMIGMCQNYIEMNGRTPRFPSTALDYMVNVQIT